MKINKNMWLFVGIGLWGIPTGVFLSLIFASIEPGSLLRSGGFDETRFFRCLMIVLPLFALLGFWFGSFMAGQMRGSKVERK